MTDDQGEIRQLIDNWVLWRDAGLWDRFATVWHDDGWMTATWFQGPASQFIEISRDGFERGVNILHFQGAHTADVAGSRAVAQTKMQIHQRATVDGVLVDVVVTGRFYDFLEKRTAPSTALRASRWGIVRRQPIYEKDRMDPVDPGGDAGARSGTARALSRGLPPPRLSAVERRLHRQGQPAGIEGRRGAEALRRGHSVARGLGDGRHAA